MRFGDGAWRMLDDVTPVYLARVDAVEIADTLVLLHVSDRVEEARWATLGGHMFRVRISSPSPNVFRIQVTHHKGRAQRGPKFELPITAQTLEVEQSADSISVTSGQARLIITKKPWAISLQDVATGETVTKSPFKSLGLMEKRGHGTFVREQLTLAVGEQVYGLGERFSALTRNGQVIDMWNSDCGTCSDKGYKDVPFFLTSRGWGVFVNDSGDSGYSIGKSH